MEGSGWRWGRVRGWLLYDDVADAVADRVSEVLPRLAGLGLVQRVDVRPPARSSPVWLYRITDEGVRLLAEREDGATPPLPPVREDAADAGTFFVPRRMWPGLRLLQSRARSGGGWMSLRQLAAARARLDSEDAGWLIRSGLVERQRLPGTPSRGTWQYRASAAGLWVRQTAPHSSSFVRVQIRKSEPVATCPHP